ncbi:MAG: polysaccharide biosynthesis tyrosine autokinase [Nitrospinota bacterium]
MSGNPEKNSYELLDVPQGATDDQIEKAYLRARALYGEDSVATYSLYSTEEREFILKQIINAYETLKDPARRQAYDMDLKMSKTEINQHEPLKVVKDGVPGAEKQHDLSTTLYKTKLKDSLIVVKDSDPVAAEHYRILYTMLEAISLRDYSKTFALTSAVKGEGKTTTTLNLAYVMAKEFKKKTVVIECDLKNPAIISNHLETAPKAGLVEVVENKADLKAGMLQVAGSDLYILPVLRPVRNSPEILSSRHFSELLGALKTEFDFILMDCPPIIPLADMNIIAKMAEGMLLVVRAGKTPKDMVLKAANSLSGTNIVGVVLNGVEKASKQYYYQYGGGE